VGIKVVKKDDLIDNTSANPAVNSTNAPKPFIKTGAQTERTPIQQGSARDIREVLGGPRQSDSPMLAGIDANRLTVGKNISLNGEIVACEKLIVEGRVEATLHDAHIIEVSKGGCFKGNADVKEAFISGSFIGTLVVKELLTIRTGGQVEGSIRYGRIHIEDGGTIIGDMASLEGQGKELNSSDQN
jgi:cytoskeletal protein CcmA (bactofilin family)